MAEAEEKTETTPEAAPPPAAPRNPARLVTMLLAANTALLLVVALVVAFLAVRVLRHPASPSPAAAEHAPVAEKREAEKPAEKAPAKGGKEMPGAMVRLADFVVHLRDPDADRYARLSFEVELPDEKAKEAFGARMPQVRDAFLAFLSDRTTEDLRGSEAMTRVKASLVQKLSEIAPNSGVRGLYLTELVVQ